MKLLKAQITTDTWMEKLESEVMTRAREVREIIAGARGNMANQEKLLQAAIVAVPHPSHAKVGIACLEAGLHTLVEKPLDVAVSAARRLCAAAEKSGRKFAIMLNQREDPVFQKAREIIRSGRLGELRRSVWIITNWFRTQHYYDSGSWRATWGGEGGGVLLNQAPHNLDLWQWICGMPRSVAAYCDVAKYHRIEVEDEAGIFVRYENGATGVLLTSTGEAPGTNRLEICGDHGKIVLENGKLASWLTEESIRNISETSDVNFLRPANGQMSPDTNQRTVEIVDKFLTADWRTAGKTS